MTYLLLFWEFFKAGLFAIGGGLSTIPFLYDISDKTEWFSHGEIADMIAISEMTPGPVGINMSTYAGFITAGIPGAVVATFGLVMPSLIITLIIASALKKFKSSKYSDAVFYGMRPASTGLVASAALSVVMIALLYIEHYNDTGILLGLFNWKAIILAVVIWILTNITGPIKRLHPGVFILLSAVAGIVFNF